MLTHVVALCALIVVLCPFPSSSGGFISKDNDNNPLRDKFRSYGRNPGFHRWTEMPLGRPKRAGVLTPKERKNDNIQTYETLAPGDPLIEKFRGYAKLKGFRYGNEDPPRLLGKKREARPPPLTGLKPDFLTQEDPRRGKFPSYGRIHGYGRIEDPPPLIGKKPDFLKREVQPLGRKKRAGVLTPKDPRSIYPQKIRIPRGGFPGLRRFTRASSFCPVPDFMNTAEIDCEIWPTTKTCSVSCIFGYTFPEGIKKTFECNNKDNKWTPDKFEECKPYVNCGVTLAAAGDLSCTDSTDKEGPNCKISCLGDKEHEEISTNSHVCGTGSIWTPPLPYCAVATNDTILVTEPEVQHKRKEEKTK